MILDPRQDIAFEQHVAGLLADLDTAGLRELAGDFLRLRAMLQRSMPDMNDWYDGDGDEIALLGAAGFEPAAPRL